MADSKEKLIKAIEVLADKVTGEIKADDALKYTQAANNAANTICSLPLMPTVRGQIRRNKMDIVNKLTPLAVSKKEEILNILQGIPIKDAQLALDSAMYFVNTCLEEQTKNTVFYDNQIVNDWFDVQ